MELSSKDSAVKEAPVQRKADGGGAATSAAGAAVVGALPYGQAVQRSGGGGADGPGVHAAAAQGVAGAGGALPYLSQIQASFGGHDVSHVQAHTDGAAAGASRALGAQAFTTGSHVAFGRSPDLHTAAHEAAHVVQQKAGVQLKGGVGQAGDTYERHADAIADRVVQGRSATDLLSRSPGGGAAGSAVQSKAVQFLGKKLNEELGENDEKPAHGESKGQQRRYSPEQYVKMWEEEQGRKMTAEERETIDRGCIGLTATNLRGGGNPLDAAEKVYGDFDRAHEYMQEKNRVLNWMSKIPLLGALVPKTRYVVFAKLFWSNQSAKWEDRLKPDENAYKPDPKTGEVDMTGYEYRAQSRWETDASGNRQKSGYVNFDYGFWDEVSQCFWHANHMDYGDPTDPMIVLQSTKEKFCKGYIDFDRILFGVAKADNYDAGLAALKYAGGK